MVLSYEDKERKGSHKPAMEIKTDGKRARERLHLRWQDTEGRI